MLGVPAGEPQSAVTVGVPRIPASVTSRPRLVTLLDEAVEVSPIVLVKGPERYGKTTAVADWAHHRSTDTPLVWLTIEGGKASTREIWAEILAAGILAAEAGSRYQTLLQSMSEMLENGSPLRQTLVHGLTALGEIIFVFDGVDSVNDDCFIKDLMWCKKFEYAAKSIIITGQDSMLATDTFRMDVDARTVGIGDLRLTRDEIAEALRNHPEGLDADDVFNIAGGNPSIFRALAIRHAANPEPWDAARVEEAMTAHVRQSIHQFQLFQENEDLLLNLSVAEWFTADLALKLTGDDRSEELIRTLHRRGQLKVREGKKSPEYSMADVIRTALNSELLDRHPERLGALNRVLVSDLLSKGETFAALEIAIKIQDLQSASEIIRDHQVELFTMLPDETAELLQTLSVSVLAEHPILLMAMGIFATSSSTTRAHGHRLLELALASADSRRGSGLLDRIENRLVTTVAHRLTGNYPAALKAAASCVELLNSAGFEGRALTKDSASSIYLHAGVTYLLTGDYAKATYTIRRAVAIGHDVNLDRPRLLANGLLALSLSLEGRMSEAAPWLDASRHMVEPPGGGALYCAVPFLLASCLMALEQDDLEAANLALEAAEEAYEDTEFWPLITVFRSYLSIFTPGEKPDIDRLERAMVRSDEAPISEQLRVLLSLTLSTAYLSTSNPGRAAAAIQEIRKEEWGIFAAARIAICANDFEEANRVLTPLSGMILPERQAAQYRFLKAATSMRTGHPEYAAVLASEAMHVLRRTGMGSTTMMLPEPAVEALADAGFTFPEGMVPRTLLKSTSSGAALTIREQVALQALAEHRTAAAAAKELSVSVNTVKAQSRSIYRKLRVGSLQDAVSEAARLGILKSRV